MVFLKWLPEPISLYCTNLQNAMNMCIFDKAHKYSLSPTRFECVQFLNSSEKKVALTSFSPSLDPSRHPLLPLLLRRGDGDRAMDGQHGAVLRGQGGAQHDGGGAHGRCQEGGLGEK